MAVHICLLRKATAGTSINHWADKLHALYNKPYDPRRPQLFGLHVLPAISLARQAVADQNQLCADAARVAGLLPKFVRLADYMAVGKRFEMVMSALDALVQEAEAVVGVKDVSEIGLFDCTLDLVWKDAGDPENEEADADGAEPACAA